MINGVWSLSQSSTFFFFLFSSSFQSVSPVVFCFELTELPLGILFIYFFPFAVDNKCSFGQKQGMRNGMMVCDRGGLDLMADMNPLCLICNELVRPKFVYFSFLFYSLGLLCWEIEEILQFWPKLNAIKNISLYYIWWSFCTYTCVSKPLFFIKIK